MTQMDFQIIAENIRKYRILQNITQEKMAEYLNIDSQFYAQLEQCRRNFTMERIFDACRALHVNIEDIVPVNAVDPDEEKKKNDTLRVINKKLPKCSSSQLLLIDKFIDSISSLV